MSWLEELTLTTVIVHLKGDSYSLKGVLSGVHDDCLILRDAIVLEPDSQVVLDGHVVIPRGNVAFMQRLNGGAE